MATSKLFADNLIIFFVLANENKIDLCRRKSPLSKNETHRDGSNPFIIYIYDACIGVGKPDKVLGDESERNIN